MTAPNLLSPTTITGESVQQALTTTLTADILVTASSHLYKIENIMVTNIDGTNSANLTLGIIKSGGSVIYIASTVAIPANTAVIINGPYFLEEGDTLEGGASANGDLVCTVNYLDIS